MSIFQSPNDMIQMMLAMGNPAIADLLNRLGLGIPGGNMPFASPYGPYAAHKAFGMQNMGSNFRAYTTANVFQDDINSWAGMFRESMSAEQWQKATALHSQFGSDVNGREAWARHKALGVVNNPMYQMASQFMGLDIWNNRTMRLNEAELLRTVGNDMYAQSGALTGGLAIDAVTRLRSDPGYGGSSYGNFGQLGTDYIAKEIEKQNHFLRGYGGSDQADKSKIQQFRTKLQNMTQSLEPLKEIFGNDVPKMLQAIEQLTGKRSTQVSRTEIRTLASEMSLAASNGNYTAEEAAVLGMRLRSAASGKGVDLGGTGSLVIANRLLGSTNGIAGFQNAKQVVERMASEDVVNATSSGAARLVSGAYSVWSRRTGGTYAQFEAQMQSLISSGRSVSQAAQAMAGTRNSNMLYAESYTEAAQNARNQGVGYLVVEANQQHEINKSIKSFSKSRAMRQAIWSNSGEATSGNQIRYDLRNVENAMMRDQRIANMSQDELTSYFATRYGRTAAARMASTYMVYKQRDPSGADRMALVANARGETERKRQAERRQRVLDNWKTTDMGGVFDRMLQNGVGKTYDEIRDGFVKAIGNGVTEDERAMVSNILAADADEIAAGAKGDFRRGVASMRNLGSDVGDKRMILDILRDPTTQGNTRLMTEASRMGKAKTKEERAAILNRMRAMYRDPTMANAYAELDPATMLETSKRPSDLAIARNALRKGEKLDRTQIKELSEAGYDLSGDPSTWLSKNKERLNLDAMAEAQAQGVAGERLRGARIKKALKEYKKGRKLTDADSKALDKNVNAYMSYLDENGGEVSASTVNDFMKERGSSLSDADKKALQEAVGVQGDTKDIFSMLTEIVGILSKILTGVTDKPNPGQGRK